MKASPNQTSFNTGEISQLMLGRVDFDRLRSSLEVCVNAHPHIQGPWTRRPGFYFCDEVKDSNQIVRTVRFKFSTGQAYAIEIGHLYARFKKSRAPVHDVTLTITNITNGAAAVLSYTGTDPANGDDMDLSGLMGPLAVLNGLRVRVANVNTGANTFECRYVSGANVNTSSLGAYTAGGVAERVYTLTTPYEQTDVFRLKFSRSVDKLYIFHPDYPEASLNRFGDANWTHTPLVFLDGPYLPVNTTATTLSITAGTAGPGAGKTITASAETGINDDTGFQDSDVGRYIRSKPAGAWGYALITARTSTTVIIVTIINDFASTAATVTWRLGLLSDTTGYSACGTFFGDRFTIGGCPYRPSRFDMSKTGDYVNFAETATDGVVTDASAVSRSLNSEDVQSIRWMVGTSNGMVVGTKEGEWLVTPSTNGEAITPTNVEGKQSSGWGGADVEALKIGTNILFLQGGGRRLREVTYQFATNTLESADIAVLAEHITKGGTTALSGLVELAYAKERIPLVWGPRKDGVLVGVTYSAEDKVIGWHRHPVGGFSNVEQTAAPLVKSCCVLPADDESYDELWVVTERYVNGRVVKYNEFLTKIWEHGDNQVDAFFVDSGRTYSGAATQTLTGLHHLVGQTVQVLVNGATHPDVVVSEFGTVALNIDALLLPTLTAHVGFAYDSDGQSLRPEAGSAEGTAQGKIQRTHLVTFRLLDTLGLSVGKSFAELQLLTFRKASHPTGVMVPLFTGDFGHDKFHWSGDYTTENKVCWRIRQPLPGTILSLMPRLNTED